MLELGTGWFPALPIGLYLSGVDRVVSIGIQELGRGDLQRAFLDVLFTCSLADLQCLLPSVQEVR